MIANDSLMIANDSLMLLFFQQLMCTRSTEFMALHNARLTPF